MKKNFWILVIMVFTVGRLSATPMEMILGTNLRAYALEKVAYGYISVWSQGLVDSQESVTYRQIERTSADSSCFKLIESLGEATLAFELLKPETDSVQFSYVLCAEDDEILFFDYRSGYLKQDKFGEWYAPSSLFNVDLEMNYNTPIYLKGVIGAKVLLRDKEGKIVGERWLEVRDGKMYFPRDLVMERGEMVVTYQSENGWQSMAYSLLNGEELPVTRVYTNVPVRFKDIFFFGQDPGSIYWYVRKDKEENPLMIFSLTSFQETIFWAINDQDTEANGLAIRYRVDKTWSEWQYLSRDQIGYPVPLSKGEYQAYYLWNAEDWPTRYGR